jgi:hypothetical protein
MFANAIAENLRFRRRKKEIGADVQLKLRVTREG